MTTPSTTTEFSVSKLCALAYRQCAIIGPYQSPSTQQIQAAIDVFSFVNDDLQAEGLVARVVEFRNVTMTQNVSQYTMATDVIDVVNNAMFIDAGQPLNAATGETLVRLITRQEWQELSAKGAFDRPTMYYPHRTADAVVVYVWPIPSASQNGATIRFEVQRLRTDVSDGGTNADYERYWNKCLIYTLAYHLAIANALPAGRIGILKGEAREALEKCKARSFQQGPSRMKLTHRTSWGRS